MAAPMSMTSLASDTRQYAMPQRPVAPVETLLTRDYASDGSRYVGATARELQFTGAADYQFDQLIQNAGQSCSDLNASGARPGVGPGSTAWSAGGCYAPATPDMARLGNMYSAPQLSDIIAAEFYAQRSPQRIAESDRFVGAEIHTDPMSTMLMGSNAVAPVGSVNGIQQIGLTYTGISGPDNRANGMGMPGAMADNYWGTPDSLSASYRGHIGAGDCTSSLGGFTGMGACPI